MGCLHDNLSHGSTVASQWWLDDIIGRDFVLDIGYKFGVYIRRF
jgi:hypothetical protein